MAENPVPARRRFQFRLRTVFVVVTLLAVWMGWQAHIVRHRKEMLDWMIARQWAVVELGPDQSPSLPWHRRLMGDRELSIVIPDHGTHENQQEVQAAFPKARILAW